MLGWNDSTMIRSLPPERNDEIWKGRVDRELGVAGMNSTLSAVVIGGGVCNKRVLDFLSTINLCVYITYLCVFVLTYRSVHALPQANTHTYIYTSVSQKFCNILQTRGSILLLRRLLMRSWRWQSTLDSEILSSPDTL